MKQNFIVYLNDDAGKMVTFERFACARLDTVKRNMTKLLKSSLYRACIKPATSYSVYRTPDGYQKETTPAFTATI